ncbi:DUF4131 domain-containing protein, partial [Thiolapillus sp.]|uniref:DUF4131 domain-containing protein n=1 Tax=Thiolapillus sp. TaxID=2017437 RepID=UPI003AF57A60
MTRTAGAPIGCQRPSRFWGLGCPKIFHEAEDTLVRISWYKQAPALTAGERWTLPLRLKKAHGYHNPGGFDYEG